MQKIPEKARRRLVQLAQILLQQKTPRVTSLKLENLTGWSSSLIRKDISMIHYNGGVSNGYDVQDLRCAICTSLNLQVDNTECNHNCCIVGLGKLGAALLENSIFSGTPFCIVAGFDANVNRTEILSASFPLHPTSRMESVILEKNIEYAILTVSNETAQKMADILVKCGIKGIVNYTSEVITVPKQIAVENVSPITAMNNLSALIAAR